MSQEDNNVHQSREWDAQHAAEQTTETTTTETTVEKPSVPDPKEEHRVDTNPPEVEKTVETTKTRVGPHTAEYNAEQQGK